MSIKVKLKEIFMILDDDIRLILQQWQLNNIRPFSHLAMTNNYVVIAYSDEYQTDVVLKIGKKSIIDREIQALQHFQGNACVTLLKLDASLQDYSVLLLEYIKPGTSLKNLYLQDKEAETIKIFVDVVKRLHTSPFQMQPGYEQVQTAIQRMQLLHDFQTNNEQLKKLLPIAARLSDQLLKNQGPLYFLHGDLHHENILQKGDNMRKPEDVSDEAQLVRHSLKSEEGKAKLEAESEDWVMIDPQGVIAELEYEVGAFIRNPLFEFLDNSELEKVIENRFDRLAESLNLNRQKMIAWTFVQTVLSACFTEENNNVRGQQYFITIAKQIQKIGEI